MVSRRKQVLISIFILKLDLFPIPRDRKLFKITKGVLRFIRRSFPGQFNKFKKFKNYTVRSLRDQTQDWNFLPHVMKQDNLSGGYNFKYAKDDIRGDPTDVVEFVIARGKIELEPKLIDFSRDELYNIPTTNIDKWWEGDNKEKKHFYVDWIVDSATSVFDIGDAQRGYDYLLYKKTRKIKKKTIEQILKELETINPKMGDNPRMNCIPKPILDYFYTFKVGSRNWYLYKRAQRFCQEYPKGIPWRDIQKIVDALQVTIKIFDMTGKLLKIFRSKHKSKKTFEYVHTRHNHLDVKRTIKLSEDEFQKIMDQGYQLYRCMGNMVVEIMKYGTRYILEDSVYLSAIRKIYETTDLYNYKLSSLLDKENLINFIRSSIHIPGRISVNVHIEDINTKSKLFHLDQKKAYLQYTNNKYYKKYGFPTIFSQIKHTDKIICEYGFYKIRITSIPDKYNNVFSKIYKLDSQSLIFHRSFLKFLDNYNITYTISEVVICSSKFEMEFPEEMLKQLPGIRAKAYQVFCGSLAQETKYYKYRLKIEDEFEKFISKKMVKINDNEYQYKVAKSSVNTYPHILSCILSYQMISMIEQTLEYDYNDIVQINCDAIYSTKLPHVIHKTFKFKDYERRCSNYTIKPFSINERFVTIHNSQIPSDQEFIVTGEAGTGKTYFCVHDKTLNRIIYVAKSWRLLSENFECPCCGKIVKLVTLCRLLGENCPTFKKTDYEPGTIIIDEATMLTESERQFIKKTYKNSKIIYAGDWDMEDGYIFQMPPFEIKIGKKAIPMNIRGIKYITMKINHRIKCDKLRRFLNIVRSMKLPIRTVKRALQQMLSERKYELQDYIITYKHSTIARITKKMNPKFDKVKCIAINTKKKNGIYKGVYKLFDKGQKIPKIWKNCHASTIHSIQGTTLKKPVHLFIDMKSLNNFQTLYTSVSRVQYLDQLHIL